MTIAPAESDALNVILSQDDYEILNINSMKGSATYSGGTITFADGSEIYNDANYQFKMKMVGSSASVQFDADKAVYTANEGATNIVDYLDGATWELQSGSCTYFYSDITVLSKGTIHLYAILAKNFLLSNEKPLRIAPKGF